MVGNSDWTWFNSYPFLDNPCDSVHMPKPIQWRSTWMPPVPLRPGKAPSFIPRQWKNPKKSQHFAVSQTSQTSQTTSHTLHKLLNLNSSKLVIVIIKLVSSDEKFGIPISSSADFGFMSLYLFLFNVSLSKKGSKKFQKCHNFRDTPSRYSFQSMYNEGSLNQGLSKTGYLRFVLFCYKDLI